jgi:PAS domain S-box-containing protein
MTVLTARPPHPALAPRHGWWHITNIRWQQHAGGAVGGPMRAETTQDPRLFHGWLLDQVRNAVIATDARGLITYWNRFAEVMLQWTADEVMGQPLVTMLLAPQFVQTAYSAASGLQQGADWEGELPLKRKDGTFVDAQVVGTRLWDGAKWVGYAIVVADLTQRKSIEARAQASEARFARLFRANPVASAFTHLETGRWIDVNEEFTRAFGFGRDELVGQPVEQSGIWVDLDARRRAYAELERTGHVREFEAQFRRRNGETFPGLLWLERIPYDHETLVLGMMVDVSERKRSEQRLLESHAQIRALAARVTEAREEEARRISRELHDNLGQQLTALRLDLSRLEGTPPRSRAGWSAELKRMQEMVGQTLEMARRIATEVRVGMLDLFGLRAAAEWQAQEFARRTGIAVELHASATPEPLDDHLATTAYRILQEALTNIARHSGATRVDIRLTYEGDALVLDVHDNGRGVTMEQLTARGSLGLVGMRERALAVGGVLEIFPGPRGGTTVRAKLPRQGG